MSRRCFFHQYFRFSRSEQRGVVILSCLLVLAALFRLFVPGGIRAMPNLPDPDHTDSLAHVQLFPSDTMAGNPVSDHTRPTYQRKSALIIELNTADSATLTRLRGIGPVLSRRMVRYRNLLGGYIHPSQISEVYGVRKGLADTLSVQLRADTTLIRKIDLNTATEWELKKHPYIGEYNARQIIKYRNIKKTITHRSELKENNIVNGEDFGRMQFYLHAPPLHP